MSLFRRNTDISLTVSRLWRGVSQECWNAFEALGVK